MPFRNNLEALSDLANDLPRFEQQLTNPAEKLGLTLENLEADHISVRCHQITTAERWKQGLMQVGHLFSENLINGRPICLFELTEPLPVGPWRINVVELPRRAISFIAMKAGSMLRLYCAATRRRWAPVRWRCCPTMACCSPASHLKPARPGKRASA